MSAPTRPQWIDVPGGGFWMGGGPRDNENPRPRGPASGKRRASRGGAWRHAVKASRCAARSAIPPALRYSDYGFRMAADATSD